MWDSEIDGGITLRWISRKYSVRTGMCLSWVRIRSIAGFGISSVEISGATTKVLSNQSQSEPPLKLKTYWLWLIRSYYHVWSSRNTLKNIVLYYFTGLCNNKLPTSWWSVSLNLPYCSLSGHNPSALLLVHNLALQHEAKAILACSQNKIRRR
jgi:hypothetical protein